MTMTQRSTVVGVFHDGEQAREAIEALKADSFSPDAISILAPDTQAGSGAATGAVAGGILGGLGGWLVGVGALAIPGIGPFIAAGAFATALGGAAIGAGVGAIAGTLVGMGVPGEEAEYYEGEVKSGRTLVAVRANGRYDAAQRVLRQHGAYDIETRDTGPATAGADDAPDGARAAADTSRARAAEGEQTLRLREEELKTRKQSVQTGEVRLGTEVVEEHKALQVPITREEVVVERHPVERRPSDRPIDDHSETLEVPVREERVEIDKQPVVYEEVNVGKQRVVHRQRVSETLRREEARITREGEVDVQDGTGDGEVGGQSTERR